jgi:DNA-binding Xre family transcriptional regulator
LFNSEEPTLQNATLLHNSKLLKEQKENVFFSEDLPLVNRWHPKRERFCRLVKDRLNERNSLSDNKGITLSSLSFFKFGKLDAISLKRLPELCDIF